jgi:hypothetical protein
MIGGGEAQQTSDAVKHRLVRRVEVQVLDDSMLVINLFQKYPWKAGIVPSEMRMMLRKVSALLRGTLGISGLGEG